ncbi:MAG TPA: choice-of-anchor P family protein [Nocardioides sp.]|nr:choice-of-anchor P family protein [Nocardioides sp.]
MKRRRTAVLSVIASGVLASSLGLIGPASAAPAPTGASSKAATGDIALKSSAYGTRLAGGQVPAGSGMTAFSVIACSTRTGIDRGNHVAEAALPSAGTVSGVTTKLWTRKAGDALHSYARSTTAEIVLADSPLGSLSIRGVTSLSHAWYDDKGFHADTTSSIGKIVFTPPAGDPQELDIPAPGQDITIPGLVSIKLGQSVEKANASGSSAWAVALRVKVLATGTDLYVARSKAVAVRGVEHGRFSGYSAGTEADVLGGVLTSGRNPLALMPCQGTNGQVIGRDDANLDLGGGLKVEAVSARQYGKRFPHRSVAWERGSVAGINLGDGALVIDAVVGKATVTRTAGGGLTRSSAGTVIGSITADGEPQELPLDETLEIPGVAKLEPKVVTKIAGGLKVIALRVTLLDGSGAVINLGSAKVAIRTH